jgi:hypothetical protein
MKRTVLFFLLALVAAGFIFAQTGNGQGRSFTPPAEKITVNGALTIAQGMIAVKDGDITYLVPSLGRFVGFIDGLQEGARVTLEGSAMGRPSDAKIKSLFVSKLTIGTREYDLGQAGPQTRQGNAFPGNNQMWQRGRMQQGQSSCPCFAQPRRNMPRSRR